MKKLIFLDRDGVINKEKGYICDIKDFKLYKDVIKALKLVKDDNPIIIITNQASISKGICKESDINQIHNYLKKLLKYRYNIKINNIFYCKHQDTDRCKCRKPEIGLLKEAEKIYKINKKHSFFIGDSTVDIKTANNYKIQSILLLRGHKGEDKKFKVKANYKFLNLYQAIFFIKKIYPGLLNLFFKFRHKDFIYIKIFNKIYKQNTINAFYYFKNIYKKNLLIKDVNSNINLKLLKKKQFLICGLKIKIYY